MIYIFRKEMKKWHTVLWVVFASLALGSGISFWRYKGKNELRVGEVNGREINFKQLQQSLGELQAQFESIRQYARMLKMPEEVLFRSLFGGGSLEDKAFDMCVKNELLDQVVADFTIKISPSVFKEELLKSMPAGIIDEKGYVNMDMYQNYLSRRSMTPREFEENRKEEMGRDLVQRFMDNAFYVPQFAVREAFDREHGKKRFVYVQVPFKRFLSEVQHEVVNEQALKAYYEENKETYRTPERRKVQYWTISSDDYTKNVVVEDEAINNYYEKNKTKLFRISPKLKVRRLICATEKEAKAALEAAKVSHVLKGDTLDFFGRGTHEKAFEDEAFKLNNPDELSSVVKTAKGFEVIQLVARKKAEEKPLEAVKDEIVKDLRIKRAVNSLRADLAKMINDAREDVASIETFVKQRNFEGSESEWLAAKDGSKSDLQGMLAQKIFASAKRQQTYGYFMMEGKYVIYLLSGTEKSVIPSLDQVRSAVVAAYQEHLAEINMNKVISQIKAAVLEKKMSLGSVVAKLDLGINETALVGRSELEIKGLEKGNQLVEKMFALSDPAQVLQYRHDKDCYLAQLLESAPFMPQEFDREKDKIAQKQKMDSKHMYSGAFIASLQRNAKIDKDKKMLSKTISTRD